jgi:formylmethanofuran--tetrahydromethanopterin N-formyltransferase
MSAEAPALLRLGDTEVVDTFAEAFPMNGARVIITAASQRWVDAAARSVTGFATSVIGCKCEAGVERMLGAEETPDGRPGVSILLFAFDKEGVGKRLLERLGMCVLTCPTTACFNGIETDREVDVGGLLRYFGDQLQSSKVIGGRRFWRVPVMEGEFLIEERFGVVKGVGGGNLIIMGRDEVAALAAAEAAADAMAEVRGVILPFPGGIVRSGSKVGSRHGSLTASTNDELAPTLRVQAPKTAVPEGVGSILEIVIDGLDEASVAEAMRVGLHAAAAAGAIRVTAGNYGGNLGPFHLHLRELVA